MLVFKKYGESNPKLYHAYVPKSSLDDILRCGLIVRNGNLYSPSIMEYKTGSTPNSQFSFWNKRNVVHQGIDLVSYYAAFNFNSGGSSNWTNTYSTYSRQQIGMIGIIPSQLGVNGNVHLMMCYPMIDPADTNHIEESYANEFIHSNLMSYVFEDYNRSLPSDNVTINELDHYKLPCIRLEYSGSNAIYDISYSVAIKIIGDTTFIPTNSDFDLDLVGVFGTTESNDNYWTLNNAGSSIPDNSVFTKTLSTDTKSIKWAIVDNEVVLTISGSCRVAYMSSSISNPIRVYSPALRFGLYTINAAPAKTVLISGFAMTIEELDAS